ncbi:hypothetical protein [uncultured Winogradskyella sp.]|uniref:hypothetical protein n=1 Tax=uncultured Winogradskyella sp. TaxID=395353 RepID=UPI002616CDE9|nr:hypothetical protein [uncultured Winogradskyella sp.]
MGLIMIGYILKFRQFRNYSMLIAFIVLISNCSDEKVGSKDESTISLVAENFQTIINENPMSTEFLGTIEVNMDAEFYIISQNPQGAIEVDAVNGNITIADETLYDYETNPVIEATVQVSTINEYVESTITINLNDIDDIEFHLTESKQAYKDADAGNWILITENEFNTLVTELNEIRKVATSDVQYNANSTTYGANSPSTWANNNGLTIPENSYVFAIKYNAFEDNNSSTRIKQSISDIAGDYENVGSTLPNHNSGENYFVLKGNTLETSNIGFLSIYSPNKIGFKVNPESIYACEPGEVSFFYNIDLTSSLIMYQGLSTTQKQWD